MKLSHDANPAPHSHRRRAAAPRESVSAARASFPLLLLLLLVPALGTTVTAAPMGWEFDTPDAPRTLYARSDLANNRTTFTDDNVTIQFRFRLTNAARVGLSIPVTYNSKPNPLLDLHADSVVRIDNATFLLSRGQTTLPGLVPVNDSRNFHEVSLTTSIVPLTSTQYDQHRIDWGAGTSEQCARAGSGGRDCFGPFPDGRPDFLGAITFFQEPPADEANQSSPTVGVRVNVTLLVQYTIPLRPLEFVAQALDADPVPAPNGAQRALFAYTSNYPADYEILFTGPLAREFITFLIDGQPLMGPDGQVVAWTGTDQEGALRIRLPAGAHTIGIMALGAKAERLQGGYAVARNGEVVATGSFGRSADVPDQVWVGAFVAAGLVVAVSLGARRLFRRRIQKPAWPQRTHREPQTRSVTCPNCGTAQMVHGGPFVQCRKCRYAPPSRAKPSVRAGPGAARTPATGPPAGRMSEVLNLR